MTGGFEADEPLGVAVEMDVGPLTRLSDQSSVVNEVPGANANAREGWLDLLDIPEENKKGIRRSTQNWTYRELRDVFNFLAGGGPLRRTKGSASSGSSLSSSPEDKVKSMHCPLDPGER